MIDQRREFEPLLPRKDPNSGTGRATPGRALHAPEADPARLSPQEIVEEVRSILWNKVGIIRNGTDLCDAMKRLDSLILAGPTAPSRRLCEARNILQVGRIITQCALARKESRGAHYRSDFPLKDEATAAKHSFASKLAPVFFE
jgi:aspartate oxidase